MRHIKRRKHRRLFQSATWGGLAIVFAIVLAANAPDVGAEKNKIEDGQISMAIMDEYLFDSVVPHARIDVNTSEGIVTLTGTTDNILSKERAVRIAETVKGVRAVVDRIVVKHDEAIPPAEVEKNVQMSLLHDPATDSYEIKASADKTGKVRLTGTVESWQERELCETVAMGAAGVTAVDNDIDVKYKVDRPDTEIKPEVEKRLEWDVLVDQALISVRVNDGKVSLTGTVGSAAEKRRARWDAWVGGVESVDVSGLEVARWARDDDLRKNKYIAKTDDAISASINRALMYDPRVLSFDIIPKVNNGTVTLEGVVDNVKAKRAAEMDAEHTVGVISVENHIKVRPIDAVADEELEKRVESALARDVYVESYEVGVEANDGAITLHGVVDSYFEKDRAEDVAYRTNGVTSVRNALDVSSVGLFIHDPYMHDPFWPYYADPWETRVHVEPSKTDAEIAEDVRDELWWSPFVDSDEVNVSVVDGVVTLNGTVDSRSEYNAARNNAFEGGAVRVINELEIRSGSS